MSEPGSAYDSDFGTSPSHTQTFDVVIIGAGIIGLTIARQFLLHSHLSVAILDASLPCSGATAAGMGSLWMIHRTPGTPLWDLSKRSWELWKTLVNSLLDRGNDPLEVLGWMKTGSLLVGTTKQESDQLKDRVQQLSAAGLRAEYLSRSDLLLKEPALAVGTVGCAAFSSDDFRIDVHKTVAFIKQGFLLVLEKFNSLKLNHGVLEVGHVNHQKPGSQDITLDSGQADPNQSLSISMGASLDIEGNLLLGNSRQFVGFNTDLDMHVIEQIWEHAKEFFPSLRGFSLDHLSQQTEIRVGLRPYMPDGKPIIGPIPSMQNVFLATGHEGAGIHLATGTAELIVDMVLGNPLKIDPTPFVVEGRC